MSSSSSTVKSSPPAFSVRYRLPYATPRSTIGTPRNVRIGGWLRGNPTERGSSAMSCSRSGLTSRMRTPSTPRPRGRSPIARCVSSSIPVVRNRSSPAPAVSITPSAAYRASVSSAEVSTILWRSESSDSSEVRAIPASINRRSLSGCAVAHRLVRDARLLHAAVSSSAGRGGRAARRAITDADAQGRRLPLTGARAR